jgi:hypothetical protein
MSATLEGPAGAPTTGAGAPRISRRGFLAGASAAAVLVPALPAFAVAQASAAGGKGGGSKTSPLSVGFVDGSDMYPDLSGDPAVSPSVLELGRSVPAASASTGDSRFVGQLARVTVHGPYPGSLPAGEVDLDAGFLSVDATNPPAYYAWSTRSSSPAARANTVSFVVGVPTTDPCLTLSLRLTPTGGTAMVMQATWGVGRGKGLMKLRRGAFLLALNAGTWDSPATLPPLGDAAWAALSSIVVTFEF